MGGVAAKLWRVRPGPAVFTLTSGVFDSAVNPDAAVSTRRKGACMYVNTNHRCLYANAVNRCLGYRWLA